MRSSTNLLSDCHSEMSGERRHKWEGNITELNWSEMGPDSVVDIPTWCGLDGQGIESSWGGGEVFRTRPDRPWSPPNLLYSGYRVSIPGVKRPGRGVLPPSRHLAPRLKSRALSLHPLWAFVACSRVNFTFIFTFKLYTSDVWYWRISRRVTMKIILFRFNLHFALNAGMDLLISFFFFFFAETKTVRITWPTASVKCTTLQDRWLVLVM